MASLPPVQERGRKEGEMGEKHGAERNEASQIKGQDMIRKGAAQSWGDTGAHAHPTPALSLAAVTV